MSISGTYTPLVYVGDGGTTAFPYDFLILTDADIVVTETIIATGVETVKTLTTHYTVTGEGTGSGTVTAVTAPAGTVRWTIGRLMPRTQLMDLVENDSLPAETLETAFDKVTMITQEQDAVFTRTLRQPDGDAANIEPIPSKVERASKFAAYDSAGDPIAAVGTSADLTPVSVFMNTLLDDADAATARATLGVSQIEPTDSAFRVIGSGDPTKKLAFEVDGITAGTTRTVTIPNASGTLAYDTAASTSVAGLIELAIQAEVDAGTPVRALTTDLNSISRLTEVVISSGTAFDFTIPSGVRRVQVILIGVSLSGTDNLLIQLGDPTIETTGYVSTSAAIAAAGTTVASSTAGFIIKSGVAANLITGIVTIVQERPVADVPIYVASFSLKSSTTVLCIGGGDKIMSLGELATVRITRDGTDTFDTGLINVLYER